MPAEFVTAASRAWWVAMLRVETELVERARARGRPEYLAELPAYLLVAPRDRGRPRRVRS